MSKVIRVSLPTYNALTDTNPDHYALISDEDDILIKEFTRGSVTLAPGESSTINHNLGYIPLVFSYFYTASNANWRVDSFWNLTAAIGTSLTSTQLTFNGLGVGGGNITYKYYIFYDQQV